MDRLISADKLREHYNVTDPAGTFAYCSSILQEIDAAPTVDAIPVEWLNNKMLDLQNKDKALSKAAWLVLYEWQKEQEAR